ncbi:MAG: hydrolase 1, exosortase A system-associated [Sphingorhabdus sp.]
MRRHVTFDCAGDMLFGTLDEAGGNIGLLIVSGGNEIRSGAHSGQAAMATHFAALGHPVFRYDRRGIGDSEGCNGGFETTCDDIAAAIAKFRSEASHVTKIVVFGNCDAASALALFHAGLPIDMLALANPWVIEAEAPETETGTGAGDDAPTKPSAAAIRARYWARIKNPRSLIDLFTGKVDLRKLIGGLAKAAQKEAPTALAGRLADALAATEKPVHILLAARDTTALAFIGAWKDTVFAEARARGNIRAHELDSASHSFADDQSKAWLEEQLAVLLRG